MIEEYVNALLRKEENHTPVIEELRKFLNEKKLKIASVIDIIRRQL